MIDSHGRKLDYLRISVTDRCNLRCVYCMPAEGMPLLSHEDLLTFEEITRTVRVGAALGLSRVRLTGGEPLVRKNIPSLVQALAQVQGVHRLAMTTNGILLQEHARSLHACGLGQLNISLDTLRPERFRAITRGGDLRDVFRGIDAAFEAGFDSVKLNVVVMRGINEDEIADFARLALDRAISVRFIEFMAIGRTGLADGERLVPAKTILARLRAVAEMAPVVSGRSAGPAQLYRMVGAIGTIGLIPPVTSPFCRTCNRLRLTSEGKLRSCLIRGGEVDVRALLRKGATDSDIARAYEETAAMKPIDYSCGRSAMNMSRIGG